MGRLFPLHGSTVLLFALSLFLPAHLTTIFAAKAAPTKHANVLQLGTSLLGGLRSLWEPVTMHGHERRHLQQTAGPVSGPVPVRPLIYIYDLPEQYRNWTQFGDISDSFYGLDQLFPDVLKASPHWTNNTNEADYFYVNAWMYWPTQDIRNVIKELQALGPFWDRKGGADHLFVITDDQGRCGKPEEEARKAIFIQHYGKLKRQFDGWSHCNLDEKWGAACDQEMLDAEAAISKRPVTAHDMCHIPRQDIVVPPSHYEPHPAKDFTHKFMTPYIHDELKGVNRTDLLFYSGKIDLDGDKPDAKDMYWKDAGYRFGAHQTMYRMFNSTPGFKLMSHHTHETYWKHLSSSIFCLAAAGWGWGGRMKVAVTRGCIPLIVQDGVLVEFEEQLPLKEYALRVPLWMVHKTPAILQAFIDTGRVAKMQKALECTWKLHWWRRPQGRAFEVVMCELKRRLLGAAKILLDTNACTLDCGDGKLVYLNQAVNGV